MYTEGDYCALLVLQFPIRPERLIFFLESDVMLYSPCAEILRFSTIFKRCVDILEYFLCVETRGRLVITCIVYVGSFSLVKNKEYIG